MGSLPTAVATAAINLPLPTGSIIPYMGPQQSISSLLSLGWMLCDGSAISSQTYPALYAVIGTTYGGNGSPNFNLPNLLGMFLRGVDPTGTVDPDGASRQSPISGNPAVVGPVVGSRQGYQVQDHVHTWWNNFGQISAGGDDINVQLCQNGGDKGPNQGSTPTTNNDGGGAETRPSNVYVYYLIFTGLPQTA
jgi:phage-related tail fiber protein